MPPIYDDYNDECDISVPPTIEEEIYYDYNMPPMFDDCNDSNDNYFVEFAPTITNQKNFAYVESTNFLCLWIMIRMFYVIVILLDSFMMLLKIIMREGDMVSLVSTISIILPLF